MQLHNRRIEFARKRRHSRFLMAAHGDDDVFRFEYVVARCRNETTLFVGQPVDFHAGSNRQVEVLGVALEIIRHLILRGKRVTPSGKWHTGKTVISRWGEEPERIPSAAPRVPYSRVRVENQERD